MQGHAPSIDQIAVGDFVVAGGNLGTIGGDQAVGDRGGANGFALVQGFDRLGRHKLQAIAPLVKLPHPIVLFRLHLSQQFLGDRQPLARRPRLLGELLAHALHLF